MQNRTLQILGRICFSILIPLATIIHVSLNIPSPDDHIVKIFIDDMIKVTPIFAIPYLFMFLYITISLIYFAVVDYRLYFKLLASVVTGMLICFAVYYFYPTTVPRPNINGNDIFSKMVIYIYSSDNPYNCFPSIHVLSAYLPLLFAFKYKKSTFIKVFTLIGSISISLSTLFVKQHYFMDAVASVILGTILYFVFTNEYILSRLPIKTTIEFLVPSKLRDGIDSQPSKDTNFM